MEAYQLSLVRPWYNLAVKQGFCLSQPSLEDFFTILKVIFCSLSYCAAKFTPLPLPLLLENISPMLLSLGLVT